MEYYNITKGSCKFFANVAEFKYCGRHNEIKYALEIQSRLNSVTIYFRIFCIPACCQPAVGSMYHITNSLGVHVYIADDREFKMYRDYCNIEWYAIWS